MNLWMLPIFRLISKWLVSKLIFLPSLPTLAFLSSMVLNGLLYDPGLPFDCQSKLNNKIKFLGLRTICKVTNWGTEFTIFLFLRGFLLLILALLAFHIKLTFFVLIHLVKGAAGFKPSNLGSLLCQLPLAKSQMGPIS
jgi:hypothetical protein